MAASPVSMTAEPKLLGKLSPRDCRSCVTEAGMAPSHQDFVDDLELRALESAQGFVEDLELRALESKLQLLELQKELNIIKCNNFLRHLRLSAAACGVSAAADVSADSAAARAPAALFRSTSTQKASAPPGIKIFKCHTHGAPSLERSGRRPSAVSRKSQTAWTAGSLQQQYQVVSPSPALWNVPTTSTLAGGVGVSEEASALRMPEHPLRITLGCPNGSDYPSRPGSSRARCGHLAAESHHGSPKACAWQPGMPAEGTEAPLKQGLVIQEAHGPT